MNTSALILMISTVTTVTAITAYFFVKVLSNPTKKNTEDEMEND